MQSIDDGPVTNKADMWSFGLVIWEMIALSPPHVEINDESMDASADDSMLENNDPNSDLEDSFIQSLKDPDASKYGIYELLYTFLSILKFEIFEKFSMYF